MQKICKQNNIKRFIVQRSSSVMLLNALVLKENVTDLESFQTHTILTTTYFSIIMVIKENKQKQRKNKDKNT